MTQSDSSSPLIIKLDDYLAGRDEEFPKEYTLEIHFNARKLLRAVNALLADLDIAYARVSSGWRPPAVNKIIPDSAKKSYHTLGRAVDIRDAYTGNLAAVIAAHPELLRKYGLFLEEPSRTPGWVHLDNGDRQDRASRVFLP